VTADETIGADPRLTRRALLASAALLPIAGCSGPDAPTVSGPTATDPTGPAPTASGPTATGLTAPGSTAPGPSTTASASVSGRPAGPVTAELADLERTLDLRLGVYAHDTGTGATVTHRAGERFAMCSTFKALAVGAVLDRVGADGLDRRISYRAADLLEHAPVTRKHLGRGLTLAQLCDAAIRFSDNTAANLLLRELGGPRRMTAFARSLGDRVTRLDRIEPALSEARPGDPRDTTSPEAIGADLEALVLGTVLGSAERARLTRWLVGNTTGATRIRAGVPQGWTVADKTGSGGYGTGNDIAVLWPPRRSPIVLTVMSTRERLGARAHPNVIARATSIALTGL
jgi:beta-lactamase class A